MNFGFDIRWTNPETWPWEVYILLAGIALEGLRRAYRHSSVRVAQGWPSTEGRIDSAALRTDDVFFKKYGSFDGVLRYSYWVAGELCVGRYTREFPKQSIAEEFVRDLNDRKIEVHYDPNRPSRSLVLEAEVESLLKNRTPAPFSKTLFATTLPQWSRPFLWVFAWISAMGFGLSLWVHFRAIVGQPVPSFFWALHGGIFVVWIPAVTVAGRLAGWVRHKKDYWKSVLKGSPDWLRYTVYGVLGYAMANLVIFGAANFSNRGHAGASDGEWRLFSGHWMAFYWAALAIHYSAARSLGSESNFPHGPLGSPNAIPAPHFASTTAKACEIPQAPQEHD